MKKTILFLLIGIIVLDITFWSECFAALTDDEYLQQMISKIGVSQSNITIDRPYYLKQSIIIPKNIGLIFVSGGFLSTASGLTTQKILINGPTSAPLAQIFSGSGTITFGPGAVKEVYPQWWGAKGDGINDDTTAIQNAINLGSLVFIPSGIYKITATITLKQRLVIRGAGIGLTVLSPTSAVAADVFTYQPLNFQTSYLEISDMNFLGNSTTTNPIHLKNLTGVLINRIYMDRFSNVSAKQVLFENVESSSISNSMFMNSTSAGIELANSSNNNTISDNTFTSASGGFGLNIDSGVTNTEVHGNNFEGAGRGKIALSCNGTIATSIHENFFEFWTGAAIACNSGTAYNLNIAHNHLHATSAAGAVVVLNSPGPNDRVTVENNYLALLGNAGTATVGFIFGNTTNIWARGNKSGGSGTGIINVGGDTQLLPDYMSPISSNLESRPVTYNSAGTQRTINHIVQDKVGLVAGTATVTLVGSAVFTSANSYTCVAIDESAANAVQVMQTSGSSLTIIGTGADIIRYICIGN